MHRFTFVGTLALAFAGLALAEDKAPVLKVSDLARKDDKGTVEVTGDTTLVRLSCPLLRGHCKVTAEKGEWPEKVAVLLEGLRDCEHFEAKIGRMHVQGARKSSGEFELYFLGEDRDFNKRSRVGTADVRVEQRKDGVLVTFPAKFFGDADTVSLGWIDFLRR